MSRVARLWRQDERRWSDGGMADPEIKPILSPMLSQFLRRRFMELLGVLLLLLGTGLLISLVSASPAILDRRRRRMKPSICWALLVPISLMFSRCWAMPLWDRSLPVCWGYRLIRKQKIGQKRIH